MPRLASWLPFGLLIALGAVTYWKTFSLGFTHFDDTVFIVDQRAFFANPRNLLWIFGVDGFERLGAGMGGLYYRPILWVSFFFDAQHAGT